MSRPDPVVSEAVPAALDGERLDRVVSLLTGMSRRQAAEAVARGLVRLDGEPVEARSRRVREGEEVRVEGGGAEPEAPPVADPAVGFTIVHEDEHVVVVDKPAGLVVHPGAGNETGTLVHGLLARYPEVAEVGPPQRPGIVHRLDRGTSGLLMVARTAEAHGSLVGQLSDRRVDRRYQALVHGRVQADEGRIEAAIGRSPRDRTKMAVVADGREARTAYTVERRWARPAVSLLECRLETGRTHQIRVHVSAIGHPVVGDATYDSSRDHHGLDRPFLHAVRLAFTHPADGSPMVFSSSLSADLEGVLAELAEPEV